jgi:aminobenzoyl-glutamate utilization protein B
MIGSIAFKTIDMYRNDLIKLSQDMWENPEGAYKEYKASNWCANFLRENGFDVEIGVAGVSTAIKASWGKGCPAIGFLGEYDALPGLSQKVKPEKEPIVPGGYGHGCGHNLLGAANVGAVIGLKKEMIKNNIQGTIIFYGCPAEEVCSGKVFMIRSGVFDGLDLCISFHPGLVDIARITSIAMISVKFHFKGISAHASSEPENGRSALKAVELTNIGANFLREHIQSDVRMHYVITDGGLAPNIVPDKASVWYFIRAPKKLMVDKVYQRLKRIANGATMMTDTTLEVEIINGVYNTLENKVLENIIFESLNEVPIEDYTEEELEFAKLLNDKNQEQVKKNIKKYGLDKNTIINKGVMPEPSYIGFGSTDVGDVEHIIPGISFRTTCANIGAIGHSWQLTACSGHSIGHKGMIRAAKVMALFGLKVFNDHNIYIEARKEFDMEMSGENYKTMLPENAKIPD